MPIKYIPQPIILINGSPAPEALIEDIIQISAEESLHLPGMFMLMIKNDYFPGRPTDVVWRHQSLFAIGYTIKIGFTSSTTDATEFAQAVTEYIMEGEITAIETEFNSQSQAPIIIRGYDISHRLHRGRYNRSFQNMKDSDIVARVVAEAGVATKTLTATTTVHEYIFQENQTNMEFLRERAARVGFELYVQDNFLNFRKPVQDAALSLKWLEDIHGFRVRVSSAEQVSSVEVRGWDYKTKRPIVATATTESVITKTTLGSGSSKATAFMGQPKMIVVDQPTFSLAESQKIAQSLCDELGGEFVNADAIGEGDPSIRVGKVVNLVEMGTYSGTYYITETQHLFSERRYTTNFSVRGTRGGDLFSVLSSKPRLEPGQTMLVGIVSNNVDPEKMGRVRVKFPSLTELHESNWARVVGIGAGNQRGFDCLPEINDEVLVAFEHGDIHRPYVIGGVWNGIDKTPTTVDNSVASGKVRLRTFKTRVGHQLQFVEDDKDTKKGVYLNTAGAMATGPVVPPASSVLSAGAGAAPPAAPAAAIAGGHYLRMNDSDKFVELETAGNGVLKHKFRADDATKVITLTSTGDITVKSGSTGLMNKISVSGGEIELTAMQKISLTVGTSKIEITQTGITIQTLGQLKESGTMIDINGTATVTVAGGIIRLN